jgi:acyl phosphate:glycerol-3-phosphate acyltransferase
MNHLGNIIWLLIAFLIGSIPTAYIVAKRVRGIDIREHGSGNVGATNVFRIIGKSWGSVVLCADLAKGLVVVSIIALNASAFPNLAPTLKQLIFGLAAIAGHTWTPWLNLKGGKGVATACGMLIGIFPSAAVVSLLIWVGIFGLKRYVSLASIAAAGSFPILLLFFYRSLESFALIFLTSLVLCGLLIYNHRTNIERLKKGEEPQVQFGKSKGDSHSQERQAPKSDHTE